MILKIGNIWREVKSLNEAEMNLKELRACGWSYSYDAVAYLERANTSANIATINLRQLLEKP